MEKQWNKVPLAVIIGAILSAPAYADVDALNGQASVGNNLTVDYQDLTNSENEATLSGSALSDTVGVVHSNVSAGFANLASNTANLGVTTDGDASDSFGIAAKSQQISAENTITLEQDSGDTNKDNLATVGGGGTPYQGAKGILGSNTAAGVANVQANTVAVGYTDEVGTLDVEAMSGQVIGVESDDVPSNVVVASGSDNYATFDGGFNSVEGIVGVNVSAGSVNQQSNTASLAKGNLDFDTSDQLDADTVSATAGSSQSIINNWLDGSGEPHSYLSNNAEIADVMNDAKGLTGVNVNAGDLNAQTNNASLAFFSSGDSSGTGTGTGGGNTLQSTTLVVAPSVTVESSSSQIVEGNVVDYIDNRNTDGIPENNASVSNAFMNYQGVLGTNTAAGQTNAQANNVAAAYVDNEDKIDTEIMASSSQTIMSNKFNQESSISGLDYGNVLNKATVDGNAYNNASGLIGSNTAAGQSNAQSNNASLAYVEGEAGTNTETSAKSIQTVDSNIVNVNDPAGEADYNKSMATLGGESSAFNGVQGVIGANVAAGQQNAQANNAAIGASDSAEGNSTLSAVNGQDVSFNFTSNFDDIGTIGNGLGAGDPAEITNEADLSNAFNSDGDVVMGIVGANVAAGQGNAQSNNAALGSVAGEGEGDHSVTTMNVQNVDGNYVAVWGDGNDGTIDPSTDPIENSANFSNAFENASGIMGVNVTAGQANAQSNNVSLGSVETGTGNATVTTGSLQVIGGFEGGLVQVGDSSSDNSNVGVFDGGQITNTATIGGAGGEVFNGASGILGVNVSSGQFNAQANNVAMAATKTGGSLSANTVNIQASILNDTVYKTTSYNNATLSDSFVGASGVMGANLAVGVGNGQANNVAMHAGSSVGSNSSQAVNAQISAGNSEYAGTDPSADVAANNLGNVKSLVAGKKVSGKQLANFAVIPSSSTAAQLTSVGNVATLDGNAFNMAKGVIGVNVAAGVGNLQSNNVTLSVASLNTTP